MMRLTFTVRQFVMTSVLITAFFSVSAQQKDIKKYPALLWEITGNGLKKPSYLFGTMHVSSKMVFHLSDSFYLGIKNADVVALELDPQLWQDQLFRYQKMQNNLRFYTQGAPGDYITEKSFQLEKYEDKLKAALSEEPTLINGLLYRTFQPTADFEEDTYLDLYIYQTGKKLGKQATGVENYFETERLIFEASQDMMKDKKRKSYDNDGEGMYDIEKKTQDAYRKGDLDLLDSLEKIMQSSEAYMEKFLYRRNEIQANSIDSIVKKHSLFVGVGAAHLPGKRGVIELLRKKGYKLRPIIMQDRDASQRDDIEKVKVPVSFSSFSSDDNLFSVQLPGKLYKRIDNRANESWQYADMSNGAYYMVTRVKTHADFLGQNEDVVIKKVDSLLYENIPGKILKKTTIVKNGYKGFDITNKTRRGDIQRYNILVTPYEVLVFKMSGNNNYVEGKEADQFFNSVDIKNNNPTKGWVDFKPSRGGFSIKLPQTPFENRDNSNYDGVPCWQYEAVDSTNGDAYLVFRKNIQNYHFIEEDTFLLDLAEESFGLSDYVNQEISRQQSSYKGFSSLDAVYSLKNGNYVKVKFILDGAHYYLLAAQSKNKNKAFNVFFDSFSFIPNNYAHFSNYTDTLVNMSVITPIIPDIDANMRNLMERASSADYGSSESDYNSYWPVNKMALFQDDTTGEAVYVSVQSYPKYYYPRDSAAFWKEEINEKRLRENFIIYNKQFFHTNDSIAGFRYILSDTNSTSLFSNWVFLKNNKLYRVMSMYDSLQQPDEFVSKFYASFKPLNKNEGEPIFSNKLDVFFKDLNNKDSVTNGKAKKAIPNVYFGPKGFPLLMHEIQTLPYNDKDYFDTKIKLINELGYINDSSVVREVVSALKLIYEKSGDTNAFQNVVFKALARHKTKEAYGLLKDLLVQDPPVFDNGSEYNYLFQDIGDSLQLAKTLFPELLQLSSIDDYKENIHSLLTTLVDSGYLKGADYESYFSKLYFEAKIQWKRQQGKDEEKLQKNNDDNSGSGRYNDIDNDNDEYNGLEDYAVLLMPFYDKNMNVPKFIDKLLQSRDESVKLKTAILLIRNDKPVADSIIHSLAASNRYRFELYKQLKAIDKEKRFPKIYLTQLDIARSQLASAHVKSDLFAIEYVDKKLVQLKDKKGYVYFFKYKPEKDDDWQMGISGLQPANLKDVDDNNDLVRLTNKKIKPNQTEEEQFNKQLKRLLFSKHRSAATFYIDNDYYLGRNSND